MESAAVSISAMFCMTVGLNINKNIDFLPLKSAHVAMFPLGNEIHHSTPAHCMVMFSLNAQNGAYVACRPCEFTCGFHQGRSLLSQKVPFCIVTFQSCAIFLAFTTLLSCEYL